MQTPLDYYNRFHAITVAQPGAVEALATGVRVDRYRLGSEQPFIDERARLARKVKKDLDILRRADANAGISVRVETAHGWEEHEFAGFSTKEQDRDQLWALIRYPYVGKGSPEAIQVALQLAAIDLPGSPPMVSPDDFQSYCDRWFGLDCNGFVGNYIRHVYQQVPWSDVNDSTNVVESNDLISTIWEKFDGDECSGVNDVDSAKLNLLVMTDDNGKVVPGGKRPHGHIVISVPGESALIRNTKRQLPGPADADLPAVNIVESTASKDGVDGLSGLACSFYAYSESGTQAGVFKVLRGLNDNVMKVRIKGASWPV